MRKQDVVIARNYLNADEIDTLNRLVLIFLETAELRAKNRVDTTMDFWRQNADRIIEGNDFRLLRGKDAISKKDMEALALGEYERFDARRRAWEAARADREDEEELKRIETEIKRRVSP